MISPAVLESKPAHDLIDVACSAGRSVIGLALHQLAGGAAVSFDIINVKAQALKTDQVVNRLPSHARDRQMAHETEQHDFTLLRNIHAVSRTAGARGSALGFSEPTW